MVKALPIDVIWKKRVIRSKIVREGWMSDNGLENVMELIKRQRWENLFKKRLLVHVDAVKEFYAKMTVTHLKKKDVVKSKVRGVDLEFDNEKLATILGVPGKNGICEYIKEVWEESKYTKPLEITRRFANDATIMKARRVQSVEMKPSQRFIHFLDHELPYGDWLTLVFEAFGVPLVIKKGEEPKKYDFFEDTFLTMCKLTREDGIWWIGSGENRRRDDDEVAQEEEAKVKMKEIELILIGRRSLMRQLLRGIGVGEKYYDAEEEAQGSPELPEEIPADATPGSTRQKDKGIAGVDPSGPTSREADFLKFQAEFERKRANKFHDELEKAKAENAKLLALLHQAQTKPHP
ncbi:hypothetical protein Dimus_010257 [Dionaea muscipula]